MHIEDTNFLLNNTLLYQHIVFAFQWCQAGLVGNLFLQPLHMR